MSPRDHQILLTQSKSHIVNRTNSRSALDDRVEDRLHVCWRLADDAKNLTRRRLLIDCFGELLLPRFELRGDAVQLVSEPARLVSDLRLFLFFGPKSPHLYSCVFWQSDLVS